MEHAFVIVDVFTERAFGGNQLAVFTDARSLSDRAMQALAREFNFAETTFVLPPSDASCSHRVRIFTPKAELPFAGHPTVGTAAVLARIGEIPLEEKRGTLRLQEGVGPIAVIVEDRDDVVIAQFTLERAVELPPQRPDALAVAAALSLPPNAVHETWFASAGVPFCFVHVASERDVDGAILDRAAWARISSAWSPHLFFFAGVLSAGSRIYARMFAPALGVDEDPATGSASAALIGTVAARADGADADVSLAIEQGYAMGRPSQIRAQASKRSGRVVQVSVGGACTIVARGVMSVPNDLAVDDGGRRSADNSVY